MSSWGARRQKLGTAAGWAASSANVLGASFRAVRQLSLLHYAIPSACRLGDQQRKGPWDEEETERLRKAVEEYLAAKSAAEQGGSQGEALIALGDDASGECCIGCGEVPGVGRQATRSCSRN